MKSLLLISLLALSVSCGKKANFDDRDVPNNPTGDGVGTSGLELKETLVTSASISYTSGDSPVEKGRTDDYYGLNSTGVVERYFVKIPTSLTVTSGHSSNTSGKVVLTLSSVDGVVECTYFGQSSYSAPSPSSTDEWNKGQSYAGVVCKENGVVNAEITSGSTVEVTSSVRLSIQSAHQNISNTKVTASIEYYQPE